jgi:hypothetical protein
VVDLDDRRYEDPIRTLGQAPEIEPDHFAKPSTTWTRRYMAVRRPDDSAPFLEHVVKGFAK